MGHRADYATKPRELISQILQRTPRFFKASDVHRELASSGVHTSLSTVYRTLERLHAKGAVALRLDEAGESAYMACGPTTHHHHAICRSCGRVEEVDCAVMDQFADSLRELHGFVLDDHRLEFVGRCRSCA